MTHYASVHEIESGDVVRLDFRFDVRKGRIRDFAINVAVLDGEKATDVYRVDTKHKHLHEQRFWISPELKRLDHGDYNVAFNSKKEEVYRNYRKWVKYFRTMQSKS